MVNAMQLIGKEKYFVHKGTWKNNYEWRIEKVKIRGIKVDEKGKYFAEFGFSNCGYEYPVSYLKDTMKSAKQFAIRQIEQEKKRQIFQINNLK